MQFEIIGDAGKDWTDTPRPVTEAEAGQIRALGRLDGIKLHRQLTNSTLKAAKDAVEVIQDWKE